VVFRKRAPIRSAMLQRCLSTIDWSTIMDPNIDVQVAFNRFYDIMLHLLDENYPLAKITVTIRDPPYITPAIKSMFKSKNKLLKKGRLEQAEALTTRIGVAITKACEWATIRALTTHIA